MESFLHLIRPDLAPRSFHLNEESVVIGRCATVDIRIPLPSIALRHCEITPGPLGVQVQNLDEHMETRVNGAPVTQHTLNEGDRLEIGPVQFLFTRSSELTGLELGEPKITVTADLPARVLTRRRLEADQAADCPSVEPSEA